jgi:deazaflavin-dependent oxidoreductase (nitroreductase family)
MGKGSIATGYRGMRFKLGHYPWAQLASTCMEFYISPMNLKEDSVIVAALTTVGRKSGLPRTVELRLVYSGGCFYASSSKVAGKHWCQNMIKNPAVEVTARGQRFPCTAKQVSDNEMRRRILTLRDSPPLMDRVLFEMTPSSHYSCSEEKLDRVSIEGRAWRSEGTETKASVPS